MTGEATTTRRPPWMWLLALLLVVVAVAPLVLQWLGNVGDQRLVDLDVYRTGGEAILEGRPGYDFVTPAPPLLPFTYPPIAALLAMPLAAMSWPAAQWVWTILIFVTLAVSVGFGFRAVLSRARGLWLPMAFAFLMVACTYLMPIRDQVRF